MRDRAHQIRRTAAISDVVQTRLDSVRKRFTSDCGRHHRRCVPAAAAAAATAAAAFGFRSRFVHVQCASADLRAVQRRDRLSPSSAFAISTKPKPRERPVSRSVMMLTRSTCPCDFEQLTQFFFGRVEIQVSNKDVLQAVASG